MEIEDFTWIDSKVYCPLKKEKEDLSVLICNLDNFFDKNNKENFYYFCNRFDKCIKETQLNNLYKDYDDLMLYEFELWKYYDLGYESKDVIRMSNNCTFMLYFYKIDNLIKNIIEDKLKDFLYNNK
jgi:hypothetical protein